MRIRMGIAALSASFVAACWVAGPAVAQNAVATQAIGGQGGGAQSLTCGGSLLGGAGIRQGALLDRIWPLCVPMGGNGDWAGAPIAPPDVAMGGRGGGGPYNLVCPPNFYVHSINVRVDRGAASGGAVRTLTLYCKDSSAQQTRVVEAPRNADYDDTGDGVACPQGFFANGINGASGQVVDRLGLLCIKSPRAAPAGPAIKRLGRPGVG